MEALKKHKNRLAYYPDLINKCKFEGKVYAECILKQENIKLNSCGKEFEKFKNCLMSAASKLKTKL